MNDNIKGAPPIQSLPPVSQPQQQQPIQPVQHVQHVQHVQELQPIQHRTLQNFNQHFQPQPIVMTPQQPTIQQQQVPVIYAQPNVINVPSQVVVQVETCDKHPRVQARRRCAGCSSRMCQNCVAGTRVEGGQYDALELTLIIVLVILLVLFVGSLLLFVGIIFIIIPLGLLVRNGPRRTLYYCHQCYESALDEEKTRRICIIIFLTIILGLIGTFCCCCLCVILGPALLALPNTGHDQSHTSSS